MNKKERILVKYNFNEIEPKWQKYWDDNKTFKASIDPSRKKYYVLDMFPYPSGAGLHVGHPEGYTATDIISRYKRMQGLNVLHPMGWDSFGLPAENHAVKTGTHPQTITESNIKTFKRQLKSLGFSYDWDRELATSRVDYYKWTQWIFTKLYEKGLAYENEMDVNWCPELKVILANEEVINGKSAIGDHPVVRKPMKQWVLKITEYAERLLNDLDDLDWPESVKEMQRKWIGKSVGANVHFSIKDNTDDSIEIFTTRPDTLFGATYMVLSPEHPLVEKITTPDNLDIIKKYQEEAKTKTDLERTDLNKDKTGVFTGSYAINPVNNQEIPIWISDYVLISYGTGAIMSVPAHDQRDYEFAKKYSLPIIPVIEGGNLDVEAHSGDGAHINSDFLNGLNKDDAINKINQYLEEKGLGKKEVQYKMRDWLFSRQRYWGEPFPLLKYEDGSMRVLEEDELPVELPEVEKYEPSGTGESPLATIDNWVNIICPKTGKKARRETHTMPQWAGSCWYYLRFCDPHNSDHAFSTEAEKYWMPVDLYIGGAEHAVLHLLYARFWHKVLYDVGAVTTQEPFQKLINQGMILGEDGEKMSKSRGNVINPDDVVDNYGADTLRLYEMFMGPLERTKPWSMKGVKGVYNFLNRVFHFFLDEKNYTDDKTEESSTEKLLHKTIKGITHDLDTYKFNVPISKLMIFTNHVYKAKKVTKETARTFALLLSPYAPHLAEELWAFLGADKTLSYETWPTFDPELAKDDLITMAVQINGKTRATLEVSEDISKEEFIELAKKHPKLTKYFADGDIVKEIFVPKKISNFVIRPKKS